MTGGITSAVLTTPDGRKHDVSALLEREQLSLDVGGDPPDSAVVKIGGSIPISRDLPKGERLRVQVIGADGDIVGETDALVVSVAFVDKVDEHSSSFKSGRFRSAFKPACLNITATERVHAAKVI